MKIGQGFAHANSCLTVYAIRCPGRRTLGHSPKECTLMPGVVVREDEPFESAIRRFKKQLQRSGVLGEAKRRRAYDKPSVKKKKKSILARKRLLKKLRRMRRYS
jgi:small subunit ribosomal protein S21